MATGKYKKKNRGATDLNSSGRVHNVVVSMRDDSDKNEPDVPLSFLVALVVLCIVLIIVIPVMAVMYMDMNTATNAALEETRKMRALRTKLLLELQGE